jgi:hypothetical protein
MSRDIKFGKAAVKRILKHEYGEAYINNINDKIVDKLFFKLLKDKDIIVSESVTDMNKLIEYAKTINEGLVSDITGRKVVKRMEGYYVSMQGKYGGFLAEEAECIKSNLEISDKFESRIKIKTISLEDIINKANVSEILDISRRYGYNIEANPKAKEVFIRRIIKANIRPSYNLENKAYEYQNVEYLFNRFNNITFEENFMEELKEARFSFFEGLIEDHAKKYEAEYKKISIESDAIKSIIYKYRAEINGLELLYLKNESKNPEDFEYPYLVKNALEKMYVVEFGKKEDVVETEEDEPGM